MTRLIIPVILIAIAVTMVFTFTNPLYKDISALRVQSASFDEALNNSKALENERDKLTQKYNLIGADNLAKLAKLLPESVDNIRLILEIEKIAAPYGMTLKNVKYDVANADTSSGVQPQAGNINSRGQQNYGVWNLQFSTSGSYSNFLKFTKDLESNLRIVDILSIDFTSDSLGSSGNNQNVDFYNYNFNIRTYWLKN